jgi:2-polyprenyl-3-methyl-5-hydroxy-6-metoxy-1,4-benzoquinol methylase
MSSTTAGVDSNIKEKVYHNEGNKNVLAQVTGSGLTILDAGCGHGDNAALLKQMGHTVDGVTISEKERAQAAPVLRNGYIFNLENGLPDAVKQERYDVVICSHVLEHICYPQQLLKDIMLVLKPGGKLIVALPNIMNYRSRFKLMAGNFKYQETGIWDYTHFRWYTYKSGAELLTGAGFTLQHRTVTGEMPLASVFKKIMGNKARQGVFKMLRGISPGFFGYELLYTAVKPV